MSLIRIIIICIAFTFSFSLYSQDFNGGVLGGVNASQVFGDQYSGPNKAGLYIGAFVNRYFSKQQLYFCFLRKYLFDIQIGSSNYLYFLLMPQDFEAFFLRFYPFFLEIKWFCAQRYVFLRYINQKVTFIFNIFAL